jgi:peptidoglycan/LPS O-acetylase OafA/YrhL
MQCVLSLSGPCTHTTSSDLPLADRPIALKNSLNHPKYRPDIDGLRALAVLAVVVFHAFPDRLRGGFIGVDIFFVISGYLISTIVIENLERGHFSFSEFYNRRIKRIFPALILVLISSIFIGWFTLLADEYQQLGKHIAGGASFISNFQFWKEAGYFDSSADTKPLLHLWSLGIEEQFYIVWPLLLWLAWKVQFDLLKVIVTTLVISFLLNAYKISSDPVATFYAPQTRFWELLVGSVLAYRTLRAETIFPVSIIRFDKWLARVIYKNPSLTGGAAARDIQSALGALFILLGMAFISKERQFPGWWAILPTLGAAMIISAGADAWFNRTVLSNKVLVWFGLISFPLYLWHWPLLSFGHIIQGNSLTGEKRLILICAAIVLAWLTVKSRLVINPLHE